MTAVSLTLCSECFAAVLLGQSGLTHWSSSNWTDPDRTHHLLCLACPPQGKPGIGGVKEWGLYKWECGICWLCSSILQTSVITAQYLLHSITLFTEQIHQRKWMFSNHSSQVQGLRTGKAFCLCRTIGHYNYNNWKCTFLTTPFVHIWAGIVPSCPVSSNR